MSFHQLTSLKSPLYESVVIGHEWLSIGQLKHFKTQNPFGGLLLIDNVLGKAE
jgi:hypothetical protein